MGPHEEGDWSVKGKNLSVEQMVAEGSSASRSAGGELTAWYAFWNFRSDFKEFDFSLSSGFKLVGVVWVREHVFLAN
jgi:hypothetical protein